MKRHHPGHGRPRRRGLVGVALGLVMLVAAAGCTGLVRSDGVYASKAAATAGAAASAVETAQLAVQEAAVGKQFGRSLAQTLAEAASDAGDVQATFDAIQPPPTVAPTRSAASSTASSPRRCPSWTSCGSPPMGDTAALPRWPPHYRSWPRSSSGPKRPHQ